MLAVHMSHAFEAIQPPPRRPTLPLDVPRKRTPPPPPELASSTVMPTVHRPRSVH